MGTLTDFDEEFKSKSKSKSQSKSQSKFQSKFQSKSQSNIENNCQKLYKNFVLLFDSNNEKETCQKFEDVYDINKEVLGSGAFGDVVKAFNKITKKQVVLKLQKDIKTKDIFNAEIYNLKKIAKQCKYFVCLDGHGILNEKIFIALEFLSGTTLSNYIYNNEISINKIIDISNQLYIKLKMIHDLNLAHGDLKPDNIIINNGNIRIIDFGMSCDDIEISCHLGGTMAYMPKLSNITPTLKSRQKTDWYSLLAIIFEMLETDFDNDMDDQEIIKIIKKESYNNGNGIGRILLNVYDNYKNE